MRNGSKFISSLFGVPLASMEGELQKKKNDQSVHTIFMVEPNARWIDLDGRRGRVMEMLLLIEIIQLITN